MASSNTIFPLTEYIITTPQPVLGNKFKGPGFYGQSSGLQTLQWSLYNFIGSIGIQATVEINPSSTDWFLVPLGDNPLYMDTTGKVIRYSPTTFDYTTRTTGVYTCNFSGNFVWLRAYVNNWSAGNVDSIILSY